MKNTMGTIEKYVKSESNLKRKFLLKINGFSSLEKLVETLDFEEKKELAANALITEDIMMILAKDQSTWIQCYLMENDSITGNVLEYLNLNQNEDIRDIAASKLIKGVNYEN